LLLAVLAAAALFLQRPKSGALMGGTVLHRSALVSNISHLVSTSSPTTVLTLDSLPALEAPSSAEPSPSMRFVKDEFRLFAETDFGFARLPAKRDRMAGVGSSWEEFLVGVVDPLFRKSDGWHFFNPDALDGVREQARRPSSLAFSGGIKFSHSF
jgi:hypothetical protein